MSCRPGFSGSICFLFHYKMWSKKWKIKHKFQFQISRITQFSWGERCEVNTTDQCLSGKFSLYWVLLWQGGGEGVRAAREEGEGKMIKMWADGRKGHLCRKAREVLLQSRSISFSLHMYYILIVWGLHAAHRNRPGQIHATHIQTRGSKIQSSAVPLRITTGEFILRYIICLLYVAPCEHGVLLWDLLSTAYSDLQSPPAPPLSYLIIAIIPG